MPELLWLLLPVAAMSGWLAGRRSGAGHRGGEQRDLPEAYFQGLNYLLNEERDKALEVFTQMVEVDSETVETHLALGSLFRRRGEVDRAIRIHQNLIARPALSRQQRTYALLELGEDYMRAGLLDRAETLFEEVIDLNHHVEPALRQLLAIYQQEKEWDQAIGAALRLEKVSAQNLHPQVAHFYCEMAGEAWAAGDLSRARTLYKRALTHDPRCVRASIQAGHLARQMGHARQAVRLYRQVPTQAPEFVGEVLDGLYQALESLGQLHRYPEFLDQLLATGKAPVAVALAKVEWLRAEAGHEAAMRWLAEHLEAQPSVRGLLRLVEMSDGAPPVAEGPVEAALHRTLRALLEARAQYLCGQCGFTARTLFWQCPGCKSWGSIRPLRGVEGE
ncbi:lipopolysaccharide assembly protein LapB [Alkalilimnicola ehrlichii MLHE-1]|uniref:Lipopolysaccharide assembly protein B n=1 Tax=Alkalilimnicola ehrlichii (strain ATCC BAA-1101 / DSM 17681 / MLHE-1) TaxID=187272 RepID=Q0AA49_ALKEH|nr:lipopolysaccharide assembly protein LapB [Alkalilimnicola ehrlichii]ABI56288.1 Tetratricopeptide TPR_2 repeat protein [Alkalilimnicola ehrlichii MLHE-1]